MSALVAAALVLVPHASQSGTAEIIRVLTILAVAVTLLILKVVIREIREEVRRGNRF